MNALVKIRYQYHVSQNEIAIYLNASRSIVGMCESIKRDLSYDAQQRLTDMATAWESKDAPEHAGALREVDACCAEDREKVLAQKLRACATRKRNLLTDLAEQQALSNTNQNILKAYYALSTISERRMGPNRATEALWINTQIRKHEKLQRYTLATKISELSLALGLLHKEIDYYTELLQARP